MNKTFSLQFSSQRMVVMHQHWSESYRCYSREGKRQLIIVDITKRKKGNIWSYNLNLNNFPPSHCCKIKLNFSMREEKKKKASFVMKSLGHRLYWPEVPHFLLSVKTLSIPIVSPNPHLFYTNNSNPLHIFCRFLNLSSHLLLFPQPYSVCLPNAVCSAQNWSKISCWSFTSITWEEVITFWSYTLHLCWYHSGDPFFPNRQSVLMIHLVCFEHVTFHIFPQWNWKATLYFCLWFLFPLAQILLAPVLLICSITSIFQHNF